MARRSLGEYGRPVPEPPLGEEGWSLLARVVVFVVGVVIVVLGMVEKSLLAVGAGLLFMSPTSLSAAPALGRHLVEAFGALTGSINETLKWISSPAWRPYDGFRPPSRETIEENFRRRWMADEIDVVELVLSLENAIEEAVREDARKRGVGVDEWDAWTPVTKIIHPERTDLGLPVKAKADYGATGLVQKAPAKPKQAPRAEVFKPSTGVGVVEAILRDGYGLDAWIEIYMADDFPRPDGFQDADRRKRDYVLRCRVEGLGTFARYVDSTWRSWGNDRWIEVASEIVTAIDKKKIADNEAALKRAGVVSVDELRGLRRDLMQKNDLLG